MVPNFTLRIIFVLPFLLVAFLRAAGVERVAVDHAYVAAVAEKLAAAAYQSPAGSVPKFFRELNYDTYRAITFKRDASLWRDAEIPFRLEFHHPGYLFNVAVKLHEFTDTHTQPIPFSPGSFDYHKLDVPTFSRRGLNFAGFRALHPLNAPNKWDEVISFLGASYFRALGRGHVFGISARGLAIGAGGSAPEEFPAFTEFWIRKPLANAKSLTAHALLDGTSVAGAYTFTITPGDETLVEVRATLFFRREVDLVGFAPVSSMFWFGEGSPDRQGDFRPEVHDSDGLLVAPDPDTRIWRPLINPPAVWQTEFDAPAFAGFGLLQRDRQYQNYQDLEARYQKRPGLWMEPVGKWPPGKVRLIEIPARNEYHDNIVAFWTPLEKIPPRRAFELAWRLRWSNAATFGGPPAWVTASRRTIRDGAPDRTRFVVDFDPASFARVARDAGVAAEVDVAGGVVEHSHVLFNEIDGSRRLVLKVRAPAGDRPVDVRARLTLDRRPLSETWSTRWQP